MHNVLQYLFIGYQEVKELERVVATYDNTNDY